MNGNEIRTWKRVAVVGGAIVTILTLAGMGYAIILFVVNLSLTPVRALSEKYHQETKDKMNAESDARYTGDTTIIYQVGLMARALSEPDPGARRVLLEQVREVKAPPKPPDWKDGTDGGN